ncbi:MAG: acyltransferase [Gammaproteobacteria bacterium]|jgi:peptidoglycan/LPS O-acetylase OafA/YrhL|nr:acyltransferase [Gammaproteobacteria bacterium]MBT4077576.1 acyltransferase [Gammaproteobacteria bacterium]MBT4195104.1 acyltransferase [Gammaproteobacteria bacterium]MBT4449077.1 acyltransferase [Gammaproteobacteria bacterium]MBT4859881.1 acyltransferase [Gammaproteobacteria bacterium]
MKKSRIYWIDNLRGLAAFFVLFQHVFEDAYPMIFQMGQEVINFGLVGVVLFFLVSGFVIPFSASNFKLKNYLISRFFRIFPLYWGILTIALLLLFVGVLDRSVSGFSFSTENILLNYLLVNEYFHKPFALGVSWTLSIELAWYVIFAVYMLFLRAVSPVLLIFLSLIVLLALGMFSLLMEIRLPFGRMALVEVALLGYLAYLVWVKKSSLPVFLGTLFLATTVLSFLFWLSFSFFTHQSFTLLSVVLSWSFSIALFAAVFVLALKGYQFNNKYFIFIGTISYSTYLIHPIVRDSIYHNFEFHPGQIVLIFFLTYLLSWASFYFIELRSIRFGRQLRYAA